jgi:hypothetical protein
MRRGEPGHLPSPDPPVPPAPTNPQKTISRTTSGGQKRKAAAAATRPQRQKKPRKEPRGGPPATGGGAAAGGAAAAEQKKPKVPVGLVTLRLAQLAQSRARKKAKKQRKRLVLRKDVLEKTPGTLTTEEEAYVDELLNGPDDKRMAKSTLAKWRAYLPNGVLGARRNHGRPVNCGRCGEEDCTACARAKERVAEQERKKRQPPPARRGTPAGQRSVRVAERQHIDIATDMVDIEAKCLEEWAEAEKAGLKLEYIGPPFGLGVMATKDISADDFDALELAYWGRVWDDEEAAHRSARGSKTVDGAGKTAADYVFEVRSPPSPKVYIAVPHMDCSCSGSGADTW